MSSNYDNNIMNESMLEAYIVETKQQIENIEEALLQTEKLKYFEPQKIDEIFRSMHSIKGASAMMMYDNISTVAHKIEDLLYFIRENPNEEFDVEKLIDVIFEGVDFLSFELEKVKSKGEISDFPEDLVEDILVFLNELKTGNVKVQTSSDNLSNTYYHAKLKFLPDCEMENLRAFAMVHALTDISKQLDYTPKELA
ncbi:MAG: Hpt domain-containing protein, partial [Proteocatella sp.]